MTKTITQTNEIPSEEGKITHTISYNLDLDGRPYGCKVGVVQEIGKYGQSSESVDIPNSDLENILQQSDAQSKVDVDTVISQALFNYLSQELQKRVGQWGHFWNISTFQPQLTYYAAQIGIAEEMVDALVREVIESGFNPGLELIIKRKQESRDWLKTEERKLSCSEMVYRSDLKMIERIAKYAFHIPGGEEKVAKIKKEVEEDIRQEAAQYFESDVEHAATLLDKEKDPDATNPFQVVDTFAGHIYDLQLFADYVPNGWQKLAALHQACFDRAITLADAALVQDNKKEAALRFGESTTFCRWFINAYKDRQPEFPIAAMGERIDCLGQRIEQKYRRQWYDLLEE